MHRWLVRYSVAALRITLGLVFLGFGVLKYFPDVSPAQSLVEATMKKLTLGLLTGQPAMILVATLECVIGLSLLSRLGLRGVIYLLGLELLGILSPVVLLPHRVFGGPHGAPTLEGQYVLKDIVLVAAAMVVVAACFRGARIAYSPLDAETATSDDPAADDRPLSTVAAQPVR